MDRLRVGIVLCLGSLLPLVCPAAADGQIVMRFPNLSVGGDSNVPGYDDWLTLHSVGLSLSRELADSGEKGGTEDINIGVAEIDVLKLTKPTGAGSPTLFQYGINGNSLGQALIFYLAPGEKGLEPLAAWKLDRAFVADFATQSSAAGLVDTFSLYFNRVAFAAANADGGYDYASWDLTKNTKWDHHAFDVDLGEAPQALSLTGDFNFDGAVDAADYTVWRDGLGAPYGQSGYSDWRANYGAGASSASNNPAPAPPAAALVAVLWVVAGCRQRGGSRLAATEDCLADAGLTPIPFN